MEIALEDWLDQLFFRRGDRTGDPASSLTHRGPTLTRVPEKWIRWLVNRGEGLFEARSAVNWLFLLTFIRDDGAAAVEDRKRSCPLRLDRWLSLRAVDGSLFERWSPAPGLAARFFCQPHHFSGARVKRGPGSWEIALEVWLEQLFFR